MKKLILLLFLALSASLAAVAAKPEVIAHRGYWDAAGAAQNSVRSLVKADSIGCYASEFDVWMTQDGDMVVNHDPTINRVSIQDNPLNIIRLEKLKNGETIPTLDEYLQAAQALKIRLVLELKSHDNRNRELAAVKKAVELVKKYGLEHRTDYIAFSPEAFKNFIKLAPEGAKVYYLNNDYIPAQVSFFGGAGIDYAIGTMRNHPEWVKQCHDLGLEVNVWIVNSPEDIQWCIDQDVDYITTNDPELVQKMIVGK